jgi:predicted MFS family arabinose efflux permease
MLRNIPMIDTAPPLAKTFTRYQTFVAGALVFLQFAIILDFMIISPLGAIIMPVLHVSPRQFGLIVSAYAFSAGLSGLLTAGFADRFDRKRILLFFLTGFLIGTLWCGLADSYPSLLMARIVTGVFGGVIGSVVLAIATDLFAVHLRGRVMGVITTAFAASQVLGLPVGLYLANRWTWHAPFLAIVVLGTVGGLIIALSLRPVDAHLAEPQEHNAFLHLLHTVAEFRYLVAFAATTLVTAGGYLLMPFLSAFTVHNLDVGLGRLPMIYLITGLCTIFIGPLVGKAADAIGRIPVFLLGCAVSITMVLTYTHLGPVPLPVVILVNVLMFVGIFSRMIPLQALISSVPEPTKRGSFNAINSAAQQLSGGVASVVAGHIVSVGADGKLLNVPMVGYVVVGTTLVSAVLVWRIQQSIRKRQQPLAVAASLS